MKHFLLLALASFLSLATVRADTGTDEAKVASQAWLVVVDAGQYAKSWDEAAALFKQRVTKAQWEKAVGSVRDQTGAMKKRELESAQPEHKLPGVPDGDYVVMKYRSSFANYASATETVTSMRDADGTWRVAGYFVK
jgi:hypothetical protein